MNIVKFRIELRIRTKDMAVYIKIFSGELQIMIFGIFARMTFERKAHVHSELQCSIGVMKMTQQTDIRVV